MGTELGTTLGTDLTPGTGGALPGIDPITVATLLLDWNPQTPGAVVPGPTITWTDDVSGRVRAQSTGFQQPSLVVADPQFNGKNSLTTATGGARFMLDSGSLSFYKYLHDGTPWTFFFVGRVSTAGAIATNVNSLIGTMDNGSPSRGARICPTFLGISNGAANNISQPLIAGSALVGQMTFWMCIAFDGTSGAGAVTYKHSTMPSWQTANTSGTIDTVNDPSGPVTGYAVNSVSNRGFSGHEARQLHYTSKLSLADRDGIIAWLVANYGVTA